MANFLDQLFNEANQTTTENGAKTLITSGSNCVDLFATIGALRRADTLDILTRFYKAFIEDADVAMRILFFARDVRGGLGERRVFKTIIKSLGKSYPDSIVKNLDYVIEFGRYDDLLALIGTQAETPVMEYLKKQWDSDIAAAAQGKPVSLLAKWLPSINASNGITINLACTIAKYFGISKADYRKNLSYLRKKIGIIENNLRQKDYSFDYSKQPAKALFKYSEAFIRNDLDRYDKYLKDAQNGTVKMHTDSLTPYDLVRKALGYLFEKEFEKKYNETVEESLNTTWNMLTDYGVDQNSLAVIDTSGSMTACMHNIIPIDVAISLGLYFADRNKGAFANAFIEFSDRPTLITIKGDTFLKKLDYVRRFSRIANTNIERVFDLILDTAVKNNCTQEELPERLVFISDMEFDMATCGSDSTNFEAAKVKFEEKGYKLPKVVFWNVDSRHVQQPVKMNEQGVILVSGMTPKLFDNVVKDGLDPYQFMLEVVNSDRYKNIFA